MNIKPIQNSITKNIIAFIKKFHLTIFIFLTINGATAIVFVLNNIIVESTNTSSYTEIQSPTTFDKNTIDKIKNFKSEKELDLSHGRINPFIE